MATPYTTHEANWVADYWTLGKVALRGIGQVMFQGHAGTGLLFLAGIAVASPLMAVGAALGAMIGPAVAQLLKFNHEDIKDGIYGFNATLVGVALMFYLRPVPLTWVLLAVGCALATPVTYLLPYPASVGSTDALNGR